MTKTQVLKKLKQNPIIAAIKDDNGLEQCLRSDIGVVFVLYGDVMNIAEIVSKIRAAGKAAIVHIDLIGGLSSKEISVDFLKESVHADGIISTKAQLIKRGRELNMFTVMRHFVIDSLALINLLKQTTAVSPDCIEMLPGVMPKIIEKVVKEVNVPVIAGGLISDNDDIEGAIKAGALAVSTTKAQMFI